MAGFMHAMLFSLYNDHKPLDIIRSNVMFIPIYSILETNEFSFCCRQPETQFYVNAKQL